MDLKRLLEWLTTAEGLGTKLVALIGVPTTIWVGVSKELHAVLPEWTANVGAGLAVLFFFGLLWRGFRRFSRASRLENPDAFTLRPTGPETLVGRERDLENLLAIVKRRRLVLIAGESGCGKSALLAAGLVPKLKAAEGLLPCEIRDWGDDWVRGPLAAALEALFDALPQSNRDRLAWNAAPDLAADEPSLRTELNARLQAVVDILGRRPLLIADQFDDYQTKHRHRFIRRKGNWLSPRVLARANSFWRLIRDGLHDGRLHLVVVTRADTALGLSCVRFPGEDSTDGWPLDRVAPDYLRPLLRNIAPEKADPPVISNPEGGWFDLRDRLERDLNAEGAVLMQQVRIVLLGLRQLPLLTPRHYRAAGGLHGVETLYVFRALTHASNAAGGGPEGLRIARALLNALILPAGPDQPPKANRASLEDLDRLAGGTGRAQSILASLERDEIVRPAEGTGVSAAWQLDHDYLAGAVLNEARQADRWSVALRDGKRRYDDAVGDWRRRLAAILPVSTLVRICWERARGRLRFGDAASYALISAIRPAFVVVCLALICVATGTWYHDRVLTAQADRLINRFGGSGEYEAVMQFWRAPEPVRLRVYSLLRMDNDARLENATKGSRWPLAYAGFEQARVLEAITALRARLEHERDSAIVGNLTGQYVELAARLTGPTDVRKAATFLRERMEKETVSKPIADILLRGYGSVAARQGAGDVKDAATFLRARLELELKRDPYFFNRPVSWPLLAAYSEVAARLGAADIKEAANFLQGQSSTGGWIDANELATAYGRLAEKLTEPADLEDAARFLRVLLSGKDANTRDVLQGIYGKVAERLGEADLKDEVSHLRTLIEQGKGGDILNAYSKLAARLNSADLKDEVTALRARIAHKDVNETTPAGVPPAGVPPAGVTPAGVTPAGVTPAGVTVGWTKETSDAVTVLDLATVYADDVARLDAAEAKDAAANLRGVFDLIDSAHIGGMVVNDFPNAYARVAARLTDTRDMLDAASFLRMRLKQGKDNDARSYAQVAARLANPADLKDAATFLRARIGQQTVDRYQAVNQAVNNVAAYAQVAAELDTVSVKEAATFLRALTEKESTDPPGNYFARSYATVASRLDAADMMDAAGFLLTRLEQEQEPAQAQELGQGLGQGQTNKEESHFQSVDRLVEAYAVVAAAIAGNSAVARHEGDSMLIRDVLTLAGHPFVENPTDLLEALQPLSRSHFHDDIIAALRWAEQAYKIRPEQLRPPTLAAPRLNDKNGDRTDTSSGRIPDEAKKVSR
ncbi:ATP-binding protein [Burkholderia sp. JPY481]